MLRTCCCTLVLLSLAALASDRSHSQAETPPVPAAPAALEPAARAHAKTIVLVRHAEKDTQGDARDPLLSAAGTARAKTLARMLASSGVTHLFASEFHRTQDTLAPLAVACQKQVVVVSGSKLDELAAAIDALPDGSVAVIAGHSNTVPAIARHFGLGVSGTVETRQGPMLPDDAYDRFYVITIPPKDAHALASIFEMRYGD